MLPTHLRITGKDIQYMLRRGSKRRGKYFGVICIPQHKRQYHQWSIQIPVKLDKRASMRNELKRVAREVFADKLELTLASGPYYKRFIFINKKNLQEWGEKLVDLPKTDRKTLWKTYCQEDFNRLQRQGPPRQSSRPPKRGSHRSKSHSNTRRINTSTK